MAAISHRQISMAFFIHPQMWQTEAEAVNCKFLCDRSIKRCMFCQPYAMDDCAEDTAKRSNGLRCVWLVISMERSQTRYKGSEYVPMECQVEAAGVLLAFSNDDSDRHFRRRRKKPPRQLSPTCLQATCIAAGLVQAWHGMICKKFAAIFLQISSSENQCDICLRRNSNFDLRKRQRFQLRPRVQEQ